MIAQFKIKNFRSILDMTLDFRFTEGKAPNGYKKWGTLPFLEDAADHRLVPCLAIFGANASGKTNIVKAMHTLRSAVTGKDAPATAFFEPNKLHDSLDTTMFELTAILGSAVFVYRLEYNGVEIRQEALTKNDAPLYVISGQKGDFTCAIRAEGYPQERLQSILDVECSDGHGHQTTCFLKRVAQNYAGLNTDLKRMFDAIATGLIFVGDNDLPLPYALDLLSPFHAGDRKAALAEIVAIVRMLDIDIRSISVSHRVLEKPEENLPIPHGSVFRMLPDGKQMEVVDIRSVHNNTHGVPVEFNFVAEESEGTKRAASLVGVMLACLKGGKALFVDELENSLHPLLVKELIRLFKDKRYNQEGSQLVFTTHNTDILDHSILRLGEVAIVRKTPAGGTLVRRLVDFKEDGLDVRNVTNFRKQYLDGFYSGIPHPAI
jgi:energy-coupling factor transporter ATP-binding protein EcfA2